MLTYVTVQMYLTQNSISTYGKLASCPGGIQIRIHSHILRQTEENGAFVIVANVLKINKKITRLTSVLIYAGF